MSLLEKAIEIAVHAHRNTTDKGGQAYILHPLRLMMRFEGNTEAMIVAVLHDVVEDSACTLVQLKEIGFQQAVIAAIDCLTKRTEESYEAFIGRILGNRLATMVKIADIEDNLRVTRLLSPLQKADINRIEKYHTAWLILTNSLKKHL